MPGLDFLSNCQIVKLTKFSILNSQFESIQFLVVIKRGVGKFRMQYADEVAQDYIGVSDSRLIEVISSSFVGAESVVVDAAVAENACILEFRAFCAEGGERCHLVGVEPKISL